MPVLFNNCKCRDHAGLYGAEAFYDLGLVGKQAGMAADLQPGDECVVASSAPGDRVEFNWYTFTHEQVMDQPDEPGTPARVQFGTWVRAERLPKATAVKTAPYSAFFNVNGHFKQQSVISGGCSPDAEAGASADGGGM